MVIGSEDTLPTRLELTKTYPNPFNSALRIDYSVPAGQQVVLDVFDVMGQRIAVLQQGWHEPGQYTVVWDGRSQGRHRVGSGVYLVRLKAPGAIYRQSVVHLK